MRVVEVYAPGTAVRVGPADNPVDAVVRAVQVEQNRVSYRVNWWDGRTLRDEWLEGFQLGEQKAEKVKIGFRSAA